MLSYYFHTILQYNIFFLQNNAANWSNSFLLLNAKLFSTFLIFIKRFSALQMILHVAQCAIFGKMVLKAERITFHIHYYTSINQRARNLAQSYNRTHKDLITMPVK